MTSESDAKQIAASHLDAQEHIRRRAYEIYRKRGGGEGRALDDWLEAERELLGNPPERVRHKASIVGPARPTT
ncbi:MAG: DUF2934 domain-containing protein [Bryobacterales bacterium]|nr:DUF2934 domain-containing protein [Bryobacterales bacterium]